MSTAGSVTQWLVELKEGEESALGKLHERYWPYLVGLARKKLVGAPRRAADEEDVAQEALWTFDHSLRSGQVPRLQNRQDFLALISIITSHRAAALIEHEKRAKRGGGNVQGESSLETLAFGGSPQRGIANAEDRRREPPRTPDEEAILNDCYRYYLDKLPEALREFAELHLAGFSNSEIAEIKGCSKRTAERKIRDILEEWRELAQESIDSGGT